MAHIHNRSGMTPPIIADFIPLVVGYQEAWRWWGFRDEKLASLAIRTSQWEWDKENVAVHYIGYSLSWSGSAVVVADPLAPPFEQWECGGFYAFKPDSIELENDAVFFGRVALYGTVIEHERGYRAEKARVLDAWAYNDYTYSLLSPDHPEIKGVFSLSPCLTIDSQGEERKDAVWLTLENRRESPGLSRSSFLLRNRPLGPPIWNPPPYLPPQSQSLILPSPREWVIRPDIKHCKFCDRIIEDASLVKMDEGEVVHIGCFTTQKEFRLPRFTTQKESKT